MHNFGQLYARTVGKVISVARDNAIYVIAGSEKEAAASANRGVSGFSFYRPSNFQLAASYPTSGLDPADLDVMRQAWTWGRLYRDAI